MRRIMGAVSRWLGWTEPQVSITGGQLTQDDMVRLVRFDIARRIDLAQYKMSRWGSRTSACGLIARLWFVGCAYEGQTGWQASAGILAFLFAGFFCHWRLRKWERDFNLQLHRLGREEVDPVC